MEKNQRWVVRGGLPKCAYAALHSADSTALIVAGMRNPSELAILHSYGEFTRLDLTPHKQRPMDHKQR